jgi:shikimate dehydrogenase
MVRDLAAHTSTPIRYHEWRDTWRVPADVDLLVNATNIGLYPDVDAMPPVDLTGARAGMLVADVFNPPETRLLAAARRRGLPTLDGLSMLVYQGVIGFQFWTGQDPPTLVMKQALQTAML